MTTEPGPDGLSADDELHRCANRRFWELVDDPAVPFFHLGANREWGIADIGTDTVSAGWWKQPELHVSRFCPFCGLQFPPSLRAERHRRLAELGIDPITDEVAEPYSSDRWWRDAQL